MRRRWSAWGPCRGQLGAPEGSEQSSDKIALDLGLKIALTAPRDSGGMKKGSGDNDGSRSEASEVRVLARARGGGPCRAWGLPKGRKGAEVGV